MEIIKKRTDDIRNKFIGLLNNWDKIEYLKNIYDNKIAIIINDIDEHNYNIISNLISNNENVIIICTKTTSNFNINADFYLLNDNTDISCNNNPLIIYSNYSDFDNNRFNNNNGDLYLCSNNILSQVWNNIDNNIDYLTFKKELYESQDIQNFQMNNIVLEGAIPLCYHLGIKTIITCGFTDQNIKYVNSNLSKYLFYNFSINIFSLTETNLHITTINNLQLEKILKMRHIFIIRFPYSAYSISALVEYNFMMFEKFDINEKFLLNGFKVITIYSLLHNYNLNIESQLLQYFKTSVIKDDSDLEYLHISKNFCKTIVELIANNKLFINSIIIGFHPFGFENILYMYYKKQINNITLLGWQDDPHYFAYFANRNGESIQEFSKTFECDILDKLDYLISPSQIYFTNLNMEKYYNKVVNLFYCLNEIWFDNICINNFSERLNNILLSGVIDQGYRGRFKFKELKKNDDFDKLIVILPHPGNNNEMREINYYKKLAEYKGAFVAHYNFPLNYLLGKYLEVLMCGCLGFFENNPLLESQLGLIAFIHYIPCSDTNGNIISDISYYKKYLETEEGHIISKTGCTYVRTNFKSLKYIDKYIDFFNKI
jgi:hypothetical protein